MAQQASSTQILAPHITARTLKTFTEDRYPRPGSDTEREVFVHSLRKHMTLGGTENKHYEDSEVFAVSDAVVVKNWGELESGLFGAVRMAYSEHYCLHLRPDDIWLAIAQGVSAHLQYNDNAEKYRHVFVDHEGKETISVCVNGLETADGTYLDWPKCIQLIINELEVRVKGDTGKLLVNDFSTTDLISKTASQIVLMDAMKHYFVYEMCFECGIPSVSLHGTLADWERLVTKARALRALNIGLNKWLDRLEPVLEKLVDTYRGKVDQDWWSRVIHEKESYGSGPTPHGISGWVCAFFPYERNGDELRPCTSLVSDKIPKGLVECPFIINDNGAETDNLLVAGSCGVTVTEDGRGVMPCIGWLVKRVPNTDKGNGNP
ncbi:hypothetical protein KFL_000880150 [Klebsormidium nitens]|uniref:Uncharacterized protein n=1 Tax=Klebsormidium nitens TaxID=105231 RepID=A0A1Y1HXL2_KLENI|nr:hypothetical protein KFL_000880150 [Klebsormidium nitens]|eukprot:GAQ81701.1 hypothetical protein KFL_000880150 [Klebsormidium nitens]